MTVSIDSDTEANNEVTSVLGEDNATVLLAATEDSPGVPGQCNTSVSDVIISSADYNVWAVDGTITLYLGPSSTISQGANGLISFIPFVIGFVDYGCNNTVEATTTFSFTGNTCEVNWYTALTGGDLVFTGSSFDVFTLNVGDPGYVDPAVASSTDYYAECTCLGCPSDRVLTTLDVLAGAMVNITTAPMTFCQYEDGINLAADIAGGTWSGTGITNSGTGSFDPETAGVGVHTITYSYFDGMCTTTDVVDMTVEADITDPVINGCPVTVPMEIGSSAGTETDPFEVSVQGGSCQYFPNWAAPTATEDCGDIVSFTNTESPVYVASSTPYEITYTATNESGVSTTCSFWLLVIDNVDPILNNCPTDQLLVGTDESIADADGGPCSADVTWVNPGVNSDNCGNPQSLVVSFTVPAGAPAIADITYTAAAALGGQTETQNFAKGTTTVTFTLSDVVGNTATCSFDAEVIDDEAPTLIAGEDVTINTDTPGVSVDCPAVAMVGLSVGVVNEGDDFMVAGIDEGLWHAPSLVGYNTATNPEEFDDNCPDAILSVLSITSVPGTPASCSNVITVVWQVEDCGGTTVTDEQVFTIIDNTDPTASNPSDINVECFSDIPAFDISVVTDEMDNCSATPVVAFVNDDITTATCDGAIVTVVRTYSVTDDCGNSIEVMQNINVSDVTDPTADTPADINVECFSDIPASDISVVLNVADNCDGTPVVAFVDDDITTATCDGAIVTVVRTYSVTDCAGNSIEVMQNINVSDITDPTADTPADINVECFSDIPASDISVVLNVADNCDGTPVVAFVDDDITTATCDGAIVTVVRTYSVTDCAGNSIEVMQNINVSDVTDPTADTPADINVECFSDIPASDISVVLNVADNCDGTPVVAFVDDDITTATCDGAIVTVVRTYSVTDCAGNSIEVMQNINVSDITDPTADTPADINVECFSDIPASDISVVLNVADNCDGTPVVAFVDDDITTATCDGAIVTVVRTYSVTDCAGNSIEVMQNINVSDITDPTADTPADINVECFSDIPESDIFVVLNVADNCDGTPVVAFVDDDITTATCDGAIVTVVRTYSVTDCAGNSIEVMQNINVSDVTDPTADTPADINVECFSDIPASDISVVLNLADNCDGTPVVAFVDDDITTATCDGAIVTVVRTYSVTDCAGNSIEVMQNINVSDITDPTADTPADINVECFSDIPVSDISVVLNVADNCDGTPVVAFVDDDITTATCDGAIVTVVRTYSVTDCAGNSIEVMQNINVEDVTGPTGTTPADEMYQCIVDVPAADILSITDEADNCIGSVTVTVADTNNGGAGCASDPYIVSRTFTLTDCAMNTTDLIQTITVIDDIAPTFTDLSQLADDVSVPVSGTDCDFAISIPVPDADDNCDAIVDVTATVINNISGPVAIVKITGTFQANYPVGINTVTVTATDDCGNSLDHVFTVTVSDLTLPTITCPANDIAACNISEVPVYADGAVGAAAFVADGGILDDNCVLDESTFRLVSEVSDGLTCPQTYTRTYEVSDASVPANVNTCTQLIVVHDLEAPDLTTCTDLSTSHECTGATDNESEAAAWNTANIAALEACATDNCGIPTVTSDYDYSNLVVDCGESGLLTVTYSVTDGCMNTSTVDYTFTVTDTTVPTLPATCTPIAVELNALGTYTLTEADMIAMTAGVTDNCGSAFTYTSDAPVFGCSDTGIENAVTVAVTVTDACMNSSTCSALVTVSEVIAPVTGCADITVVLDDTGNYELSAADKTALLGTSMDNCSFEATFSDEMFDCADVGTPVVLTVTLTDPSGNTSICTPSVTVTDTEVPIIDCTMIVVAQNTDPGECSFTMPGTGFDPAFSDNCDVSISNDLNGTATLTGETFAIGTTTVIWTATDASGLSAMCTIVIDVTDAEVPTIDCSLIDGVRNTDAGECSFTMPGTGFDPSFADNCMGATISNDFNNTASLAGAEFPIGTTTVVWIVTDGANSTATCSYDVIVTDTEVPTIDCSGIVGARDADTGSCDFTMPGTGFDPTFDDNCMGATISNDYNSSASLAGATFPLGTTTVVWTVTDGSNLTATCSIDVIVTDTEAPTIDCSAITSARSTDAGVCLYTVDGIEFDPTSNDPCPGATISNDYNSSASLAGATFPVGTTTVEWTVTDGAGLTAICSIDVIITDDENPVAVCQDITIQLDAVTGTASISVGDIDDGSTDNCGIVSTSIDVMSFDCSDLGSNAVTLLVVDMAGNEGECVATVTVEDSAGPIITTCPSDSDLDAPETACFAAYSETISMVGDNCSSYGDIVVTITDTLISNNDPVSITVTPTGTGYTVTGNLPVGENMFLLTATDAEGNTTTCEWTVLVNDVFAPIITGCPNDLNVTAPVGDCGANVSWTPPTVSDFCPGFSVTASHNPGTLFEIGTTTVTYTAIDPSGNTSICEFDVIVSGTCPSETDLFVSTSFEGTIFSGIGDSKNFIVNLVELEGEATSGTVAFIIFNTPGFDLTFDQNLTMLDVNGNQVINNVDWTTQVVNAGIVFISNTSIPGNAFSRIGVTLTSTTAGSNANFQPQLDAGSGGDNNINNDTNITAISTQF